MVVGIVEILVIIGLIWALSVMFGNPKPKTKTINVKAYSYERKI